MNQSHPDIIEDQDQDFQEQDHVDGYEYVRPTLKSPLSTWCEDLRVKWVKHFSKKVFEEEREQAWLGYYAQLYQTEAPDEVLFEKLLNRYGAWEFYNPFCDGNEAFYSYHETAIFLSDINFALDVWIKKNLRPGRSALSSQESTSSSIEPLQDRRTEEEKEIEQNFYHLQRGWYDLFSHDPSQNLLLSVSETEKANQMVWVERQEYWYDTALSCLEILFLRPEKEWAWMKKHVHADNLKVVCRTVGLASQHANQLFDAWLKAEWVQEQDRKWFISSEPSVL